MEIRRILMEVAYDGSNYHGWQVQNNGITIEQVLNEHLSKLLGEDIKVIGASRTDSGVHALGNVAVFDTISKIPGEKFTYALNQSLPEDIRIQSSREVSVDFHPRHCESRKTYEYRILNRKIPLPNRRLYTYFTYYDLDIEKMREAGKLLEGTHDFAGFCASGTQAETTVRTIYYVDVYKEGEEIVVLVCGNGFLYNMVRIIAGTLIEAAQDRICKEQILQALETGNRQMAGPTAPAHGLTLVKYEFPGSIT